jgi:DUF1680 family protein
MIPTHTKSWKGASYALAATPDPALHDYLNGLISKIAPAQEPDGYLYTARTIDPAHPHAWSGPQRWLKDPDQSHELYDAGHLFEAAAAHYQSTGQTNLLNIAIREATSSVTLLVPRNFISGRATKSSRWAWSGYIV